MPRSSEPKPGHLTAGEVRTPYGLQNSGFQPEDPRSGLFRRLCVEARQELYSERLESGFPESTHALFADPIVPVKSCVYQQTMNVTYVKGESLQT